MTSFAEKPIPIAIDEKPRIFFKFNGPEQELEFVAWTTKFLIVMNPSDSLSADKKWRMGRKLVNRWLSIGVLRIEGPIPGIALVE